MIIDLINRLKIFTKEAERDWAEFEAEVNKDYEKLKRERKEERAEKAKKKIEKFLNENHFRILL